MKIVVRHATLEDAADLARMHRATWQAAYRDMLPGHFLQSLDTPELKSIWERDIARYREAGNHIMVADTGYGLQGFVMFGRGREGIIPPDTRPGYKLGQIYSLYVMPDFLGRGLGKAMMKDAFDVLRGEGYTDVYLTTFEANTAAHKFYEKQGGINAGIVTTMEFGGKNMPNRTYRWDL